MVALKKRQLCLCGNPLQQHPKCELNAKHCPTNTDPRIISNQSTIQRPSSDEPEPVYISTAQYQQGTDSIQDPFPTTPPQTPTNQSEAKIGRWWWWGIIYICRRACHAGMARQQQHACCMGVAAWRWHAWMPMETAC